jgi:hypothetical protein
VVSHLWRLDQMKSWIMRLGSTVNKTLTTLNRWEITDFLIVGGVGKYSGRSSANFEKPNVPAANASSVFVRRPVTAHSRPSDDGRQNAKSGNASTLVYINIQR